MSNEINSDKMINVETTDTNNKENLTEKNIDEEITLNTNKNIY
jgi:hypothetical protein